MHELSLKVVLGTGIFSVFFQSILNIEYLEANLSCHLFLFLVSFFVIFVLLLLLPLVLFLKNNSTNFDKLILEKVLCA